MKPKICVFSKHLSWLSIEDLASVVSEIGFDGVDLEVRPNGHVEPDQVERDLPRAVDILARRGISCPMIVSSIVSADDPQTEIVLRTAAAVGVRYYRLGYLSYGASIGESMELHRKTMREIAELNEKYQIHGAYQNHAGTRVGGPVWDIFEIVRDLDPRFTGCQFDVRHAAIEGGMCWELGMRLLADYIRCVVIKDGEWYRSDKGRMAPRSVPVGTGIVDWDRFFSLLPETAFEGFVSLHFEYPLFSDEPNSLSATQLRDKTVAAMRQELESVRRLFDEKSVP